MSRLDHLDVADTMDGVKLAAHGTADEIADWVQAHVASPVHVVDYVIACATFASRDVAQVLPEGASPPLAIARPNDSLDPGELLALQVFATTIGGNRPAALDLLVVAFRTIATDSAFQADLLSMTVGLTRGVHTRLHHRGGGEPS